MDLLPSDESLSLFMEQLSSSTLAGRYVQLPTICVMGDTSSGKSSLLSALSMVELPSNSELTTKCPIRLHLHHSDETNKRATIGIHWHHYQQNKAASAANASIIHSGENEPATTTSQHVESKTAKPAHTMDSFTTIKISQDDWETLPQCIANAQEHILACTPQRQVATDAEVVVKIYSPEHARDLTLVDLPGFVQTRGIDDGVGLVQDVEDLLQSYLNNPKCLVVAVLAANVDFHNAQVLKYLNRNDSSNSNNNARNNTIVVLTKPDLIDQGAEQGVVDILCGKKIPPEIGVASFHMVKCRGQACKKDTSLAQSIETENRFFSSTSPWCDLSKQNNNNNNISSVQKHDAYDSMFGILNLRHKLGDLQWRMIRESVPEILKEMQQKRTEATGELQEMGGPSLYETAAEKRMLYRGVVEAFLSNIACSLSGITTNGSNSTLNDSNYHINGNSYRHGNGFPRSSSHSMNQNGVIGMDKGRLVQHSPSGGMQRSSSAAAKLHEACQEFVRSIRKGRLGNITTVDTDVMVLVSTATGDVRGEVAAINEIYACVDNVDPTDDGHEALFHSGCMISDRDQHRNHMQPGDVWTEGSRVYIARENNEYDLMRNIPRDRIRRDPSWLIPIMSQHQTHDLACFLNPNIFRNIVAEFIHEDWKPHCIELLQKTTAIVTETLTRAFEGATSSASKHNSCNLGRFPKLRAMIHKKAQAAAKSSMQTAQNQILHHLEVEMHPYTLDSQLFEQVTKAKNKWLQKELEIALSEACSNDKENNHCSNGYGNHATNNNSNANMVAIAAAAVNPYSSNGSNSNNVNSQNNNHEALLNAVKEVFGRHERQSMESQMAQDLSIILDSYGQVAMKRVIDYTPMICLHVFRNIAKAIQDSLWSATDHELESVMVQEERIRLRHRDLCQQVQELEKGLSLFESLT